MLKPHIAPKRDEKRSSKTKKRAAPARGKKRAKGACVASKNSANPPAPLQTSSENESKKKPRKTKKPGRRKRVPLAEAFRQAGIDEHKIAAGHAEVYEDLTATPPKKKESTVKLIVDVLKEWTRVIVPPPRNADRALLADMPSMVQLVHSVTRPTRCSPNPQSSEQIAAPSS